MNDFMMCPDCETEYNDPNDRRFHAQPTSCFQCGPKYELHYQDEIITDFNDLIRIACRHIDSGKVIAIKGLGGYNLVCDATNKAAVDEIRKFKKRERKPFAVMFDSLGSIKEVCDINEFEAIALASWRRPIVVIDHQNRSSLADSITAGLNSLGVFLPYLPLHHLLFNGINSRALVVTSGNESDVPILYRESNALNYFKAISGGIIINNRKIARRIDDSVIRVIDQKSHLMRRARGFVPAPVDLAFNVDGILATGAELSNAFCIGKQQLAIFSQHIGDLKNAETYEFFCENIDNFNRMYRFEPKHIACDLHPDYLSTVYANESGLPVTQVQHHHAHIAAVMAEHDLHEKVIGLAYDGTGYGTDGNIWGSELLISDLFEFHRESHFEYIPLPGGDRVTKEPWRTGLSYIYKAFGKEWNTIDIPLLENVDLKNASRLIQAIEKQINCPLSCSAGRLFDAVAAILGICTESNYHAEAPLLLENYLIDDIEGEYSVSGTDIVSFSPMIREIITDLYQGISLNEIVTKFHNSIARVAFNLVHKASEKYKIKNIALSGGSFQNKYLTEKLLLLLRQKDLTIYFSNEVSCNDGGIALGQLAVAAHKR